MAGLRYGLVVLLLLSPAANAAPASDPGAIKEHGAELLQPFKQQLMGALKEGLQQGPAEAVDTCHLRAPAIPGQAAPEGVELGRTSHRLRNRDNAPNDWQRGILQYYLHHDDRSPKTRRLEDGRVAYAEPIGVKPLCLTCHGPEEQIPAPVRAKLSKEYPDDQATGFEVGDFRGIFWVTWPADEAGS